MSYLGLVKLLGCGGKQPISWQYSPCLFFPSRKSAKFFWRQGRYLGIRHCCQKVVSYSKQDIPILEARSIEEIYDDLVERVLSITTTVNHFNKKYIIGLAGPPGAGKSTLASEVVQRLNIISCNKDAVTDSAVQNDSIAAVLPMDGFHLYRSQLDAMEDPEEAHARRGAPWTFNPDLLLKCLYSLRSKGSVYAPSFDHGVGDPVENDIFIGPLKGQLTILLTHEVCIEWLNEVFVLLSLPLCAIRCGSIKHFATLDRDDEEDARDPNQNLVVGVEGSRRESREWGKPNPIRRGAEQEMEILEEEERMPPLEPGEEIGRGYGERREGIEYERMSAESKGVWLIMSEGVLNFKGEGMIMSEGVLNLKGEC
ncbi:hypothetical protein IEQ34_002545 [Dendrobium chrysotoxum]|uniref:Uncharacterized protein n=1 Tax=Dendrobium chrysotoxum TaxID=161865 RepID=A0AAV7HNU6_DENCH|nr:hypothetical protein IEQ34_002545 [Dendrobium chrysotoxum]